MTSLPQSVQSRLQPLAQNLDTLETPAVLLDADIADANLVRWQKRCDAAGLSNRPHIKTHRTIGWALRQIELGAKGITCQTVGEAEVMAAAGITDILITTNILGQAKLARLAALAGKCTLSVVADNDVVVEAISNAAQKADVPVTIFVECDTGGQRCGLSDAALIAKLGQKISEGKNTRFGGLMTYPAPGKRVESAAVLSLAIKACEQIGLSVSVVTSGGTPDMWKDDGLDVVTEYRAGTYIYNDRSLTTKNVVTLDQCAMTILATVVSRPTPDRAILDAGTKTLTSDLIGNEGYGEIIEYPDAVIYQLNEEHGVVDVSRCAIQPQVGDRVHILPNHTCVVANLFDHLNIVSGGKLVGRLPVDARGQSH
jgi:D-serine deaminase-like pyridoxal phosphate-dependent protein